jgi:hypothetical protein
VGSLPRGVKVEGKAELPEKGKGLKEVPPHHGCRSRSRRRVRISKKEARNNIFRLVHPRDSKLKETGTDFQPGLPMYNPQGR